MDPMSMQQMTGMTGLPVAKGKKPTRRGRGGRGKGSPLNQHHAAFNKAHAAGNHDEARLHALNYANASHKGAKADAAEAPEETMEPTDDGMEEAAEATPAPPPNNSANNSAKLAALLRARKK